MGKFNRCLDQGKFYELEFLKYIKYNTYEIAEGHIKEWDIKIKNDNIETIYEVKSETNCKKYGNACIEYMSNNISSGIDATIADYWVHFNIIDKSTNKYIIYLIPIKELKDMIKNKEYIKDTIGGDGRRSRMYLFHLSKFEPYILSQNNSK